MTFPIVNLNGTSRKELIAQWEAVWKASAALDIALRNAHPNGRDYQTAAPGVLALALEQQASLYEHALAVKDMAEAIAYALQGESR